MENQKFITFPATTIETYEQKIISSSTSGIAGGGTYTNTISAVIPGGDPAYLYI